ncbi:MAG: M48 family metallopeptidase [Desulfobulbaceae bacterium]|nr:SprT family zinc-dependent metalloprotease [Desulfofustis glycolicus]MCB2218726.1 M48 family metallopeptidase [Desulfobulbaceae bacterium]
MKTKQMLLEDITIDVVFKKIKSVRLSVHPPHGQVRISAPLRLSLAAVKGFATAKLNWIRKHRERLQQQSREQQIAYREWEPHWVWGRCYLLSVIEADRTPSVARSSHRLVLTIRPGTGREERQEIVESWYREQLYNAVPPLIEKWEPLIGVSVNRYFVRRMKTRWGSCTPSSGRIRLNSELARRSPEFLEYVLVHEMTHLLEPSHNARFKQLMDHFLPQWRSSCHLLNRGPINPGTPTL